MPPLFPLLGSHVFPEISEDEAQEGVIDTILTATKTFGLSPVLDRLSCKRCIVVGNGGILANKSLGSRIDEYDIVVRLNQAPVKGYTRDVGTKTTMRITYPEGAFQDKSHYEKDSLFVFMAFKPVDFKWLRNMIFREKLHGRVTDVRRISPLIRRALLRIPCQMDANAAAFAGYLAEKYDAINHVRIATRFLTHLYDEWEKPREHQSVCGCVDNYL
ncbi:ST3 beta-galactoside alpha-2,3-sialyltransferase 3b isoform X1 [Tachysurus ichikawai]